MLDLVWPKLSVCFSFAKFSVISTAIIFAGCQRIPDQSRVTKMDFSDIVRNIRCEFQEALRPVYPRGHWIYFTGVGYQFTFTSIINNNGDFGFTGIWPFFKSVPFKNSRSNGSFTNVISADIDKTRKGVIDLKITETFANVMNSDCSSANYRKSFKYPIKGRIGVDLIIEKYYKSASIRGIKSITDITQTVDFTVKRTVGVDPTLFLSPLPLPARTFNFPLKFKADRSDQHKVVITLEAPPRWRLAGYTEDPDPKEDIIKVQLVGRSPKIPPQIQIVDPKQPARNPKPESGTGGTSGDSTLPGGVENLFDPNAIIGKSVPKRQPKPYSGEGDRGVTPNRSEKNLIRKLEDNLRRRESLDNDRRILEQLDRLQ